MARLIKYGIISYYYVHFRSAPLIAVVLRNPFTKTPQLVLNATSTQYALAPYIKNRDKHTPNSDEHYTNPFKSNHINDLADIPAVKADNKVRLTTWFGIKSESPSHYPIQ